MTEQNTHQQLHHNCDGTSSALQRAEADLNKAETDLAKAEHELEKAQKEIKEAKETCSSEVEIIVDRKPMFIKAGNYPVSVFKMLVGVAADRELDLLKNCVLHPLDDNAQIYVREHEVFISHARCGGSS